MGDWANDHLDAVIGWGLIVSGGLIGFVRGVWRVRTGHEQLRKDFDAHMAEVRPLIPSFIEVRERVGNTEERVESLEERMDSRLKAIVESIEHGRDEVRADIQALNSTVLQLLQRRFGVIREKDGE